MHTIDELRQQRAKVVADQRALQDKADAEKRDLNADELVTWENADKEFQRLSQEIEAAEKRAEEADQRKADLAKREEEMRKLEREGNRPQPAAQKHQDGPSEDEQRDAYNRYLRGGEKALREVERRALQADDDEAGGYLLVPQVVVSDLIKAMDNITFMTGMVRTFDVTNAQSLGAPSLDADPADPVWTSELAVGDEDSSMDFGARELNPHPLAKYIKVSRKLLRMSSRVEGLVNDRLAYKFGVTFENAILNGSGAGQPLGVFTASDLGIGTGQDVSTGNSTTSIQTDGLINAKYNLKQQYQGRASWVFHRDAVKQIRKLKDGNGQYIWTPGIQAGLPDTILDSPVKQSEYAPNTFTTGLYVGIIGVFEFYWLARALNMAIQRLDELYALTNQVAFIGRMEADGQPVLAEAFTRVKLG